MGRHWSPKRDLLLSAQSWKLRRDKKNDVVKKLLSIVDLKTGKRVIRKVYKRENIYSGPYIENAQDLIVETESIYHLQKGNSKGKFGLASESGVPKSAEHGKKGVFIFYDNKIKPFKITKIKLVDIAAYILYILKIQKPVKIEGKVDSEFLKKTKYYDSE